MRSKAESAAAAQEERARSSWVSAGPRDTNPPLCTVCKTTPRALHALTCGNYPACSTAAWDQGQFSGHAARISWNCHTQSAVHMLHAYGHASLFQTCCYRYHACGPVSCRALREGRNFALYEDNTLLAVTVYKRGAEAVQRALEARDTVIAEQAARIERLMAAPK